VGLGRAPAWGAPAGGDIGRLIPTVNAPWRSARNRRNQPVTPIETLCRIILRAREYEAQVPSDYDGNESPENIDGEDGDTLSVLDDDMNSGVEEELTAALDDLAEDQLVEVLAFCWIGQGTYEASEWDEALEEAGSETKIVGELMDMPMLASVLEAGMAAFEITCDGVGDLS
jgi:hypothetical protein